MTELTVTPIGRTLGIVGGGQLGQMLTFAARQLGIEVAVLDPEPDSPAGRVASRQIVGGLRDEAKLRELAAHSNVITVEIEHVNTEALAALEAEGTTIYPAPRVIALIQDKLRQKRALSEGGLPVAPFQEGYTPSDLSFPVVLKTRFNAYDGRGNITVNAAAELREAAAQLGGRDLYMEQVIPFVREIAVMVARGTDGSIRSYPPVQTIHQDHILHAVIAPAADAQAAVQLAEQAVTLLDSVGIFGVELFGLPDGEFLINEIAPRPHNAGHFSIEACATSQFEQHIRAVMGLPLGNSSMIVPAAVMINLLGSSDGNTSPPYADALRLEGAALHWYGKREIRSKRKMGHVTLTGNDLTDVLAKARVLAEIPFEPIRPIQVGIIMGSDSDLPTMRQAAETLRELGIGYEMAVVSAHRTPDRMWAYARTAAERGLRVIIAGAGGAAHLPGMVAAMTSLPVIGVPIRTETLNGLDALYSIVQMPRGVPVATVAIGNAANAGLLAARILGASDPVIRERLDAYRATLEQTVLTKAQMLASSAEGRWQG